MNITKTILILTSLYSLLLQPSSSSSTSTLCALTTDVQACKKLIPKEKIMDVTLIAELVPLDFKHLASIAQPEIVHICTQVEYPNACVLTYYFAARGQVERNLMTPLTVLDTELKFVKRFLTTLEFDISSHPELEDFLLCGAKFDHALKELTVAEEAIKVADMRSVKSSLQYALVFNGHCEASIKIMKGRNPGIVGLVEMNHFARCINIMFRNCMSLATAVEISSNHV